jgi:hypothetical protein
MAGLEVGRKNQPALSLYGLACDSQVNIWELLRDESEDIQLKNLALAD